MILSLIVAMTPSGLIGRDNQIPWHLRRDLRRFRRLTVGKPIIMGRKTFESIGRPLPKRPNIVLTRQAEFTAVAEDGHLHIAHSPAEALALAQAHLDETGEVFVIGGTAVYRAFLPQADRIYLTLVEADMAGDTYFPELIKLDTAVWREHERQSHPPDPQNPYPHHFITYHRHP
ncbi:MAG: dihydrofolate reductase [Anaerolineales bacterium]|nr:dihydrofolate reductase [Anaerolineales bacterium]